MPLPSRKVAPAALIAGALGSTVLALSMTGTLSAFTASIENSVNNAGTGTLTMQETSSDGSITCTSTDGGSTNTDNTATCSTINKYNGGTTLTPGGNATDGTAYVTTVNIKNTGNVAANTFTLTAGQCTQDGAGVTGITASTDLCNQMQVSVYAASSATGTPLYSGSLSGLGKQNLTPLDAGKAQAYTFAVSLPSSAANTYQNLVAHQTLTWAFSS